MPSVDESGESARGHRRGWVPRGRDPRTGGETPDDGRESKVADRGARSILGDLVGRSHPRNVSRMLSSINDMDGRVSRPVARSSLFDGAKTESNRAPIGKYQAVRRFPNYPISRIDRNLQIFRAS